MPQGSCSIDLTLIRLSLIEFVLAVLHVHEIFVRSQQKLLDEDPNKGARETLSCTPSSVQMPRKLMKGQNMHVVGNVETLGLWDEAQALSLEQLSGDCWFAEVDVSPG